MIDAIKAFLGGYRAVGIKESTGRQGVGFIATLMKDGKVVGDISDEANGGAVRIVCPNPDDKKAVIAHATVKFPELKYEPEGSFILALIDYELAVKSIKSKAAKILMVADEKVLDEHGVATGYSTYKLEPTAENKARVLAKYPATKFLNDELEQFETLKKPRK